MVFVSVAFMVPMPTFCSSSAIESSGVTVADFFFASRSTKRRPSMSMIKDWVLPPIMSVAALTRALDLGHAIAAHIDERGLAGRGRVDRDVGVGAGGSGGQQHGQQNLVSGHGRPAPFS